MPWGHSESLASSVSMAVQPINRSSVTAPIIADILFIELYDEEDAIPRLDEQHDCY